MSSTKTNTWISVDKKEPPFNEPLLFSIGGDDWDLVRHGEKEITDQTGKQYHCLSSNDGERLFLKDINFG
jgi:hypothetical protein